MPRRPFDPSKSINPLYWTRRRYYEKHKEKFLEYSRKWQQSHRKEAVLHTMRWRRNHRDEINAYQRSYSRERFRSDPAFREKERLRAKLKYRKTRARYYLYQEKIKHSLKFKARQSLNYALRHKYISRPSTCDNCNNPGRIEGHHHKGYVKPLDVLWLCTLCHKALHHS